MENIQSILCVPRNSPSNPVAKMVSERMLLPDWAKSAATVLSEHQKAFELAEKGRPQCSGAFSESEDGGESVAGTVSRKERFFKSPPWRCPKYHALLMKKRMKKSTWGFTCEKCQWIPHGRDDLPDYVQGMYGKSHALHMPHRCPSCKSRMKRWTCAARKYDHLELLRINDDRDNLKFLT